MSHIRAVIGKKKSTIRTWIKSSPGMHDSLSESLRPTGSVPPNEKQKSSLLHHRSGMNFNKILGWIPGSMQGGMYTSHLAMRQRFQHWAQIMDIGILILGKKIWMKLHSGKTKPFSIFHIHFTLNDEPRAFQRRKETLLRNAKWHSADFYSDDLEAFSCIGNEHKYLISHHYH